MATMKKAGKESERSRAPDEKSGALAGDPAEMRRQKRVEALKLIAGIWANREDIPADGLEYQRKLRSE